MMKLIFYGLLIYLLYKVIFEVVVPVTNGVKTVRQNMEQMQEAARAAAAKNTTSTQQTTQKTSVNATPVEAEYIDFEEVKEK